MNYSMITRTMFLSSLFGFAPGCLWHARGSFGAYYVDREPPPPRDAVIAQRPGHVWIEGYWRWTNGDWAWIDGCYETERQGNVYVQGRWVQHGQRWQWNPGRWRTVQEQHDHGHGHGDKN